MTANVSSLLAIEMAPPVELSKITRTHDHEIRRLEPSALPTTITALGALSKPALTCEMLGNGCVVIVGSARYTFPVESFTDKAKRVESHHDSRIKDIKL